MARLLMSIIVCVLLAEGAFSEVVNLDYRLQPVYSEENERSLFLSPIQNKYSARQDVIVDSYWRGISFEGTAFQRLGNQQSPEYRGVVNEIYWDGAIKGWEVSLGKKKFLGG